MMIRNVELSDFVEIARIYNHYIKNTIITFEEGDVSHNDISSRIENVLLESLPWLVAENKNHIAGYAYATKWRSRSAYRFSVESTVYLDRKFCGNGIGSLLYKELISKLSDLGVHVVIGGIALPNPSSVALHEKFGFKKVAQFEEVGIKFNKWIDVGYWELKLLDKNGI